MAERQEGRKAERPCQPPFLPSCPSAFLPCERKEIWNAACKTRNSPAGEAQETADARQGLLRQQEQAVSCGERVGRHRAEVRPRGPPPQEGRLPSAVDHPHH